MSEVKSDPAVGAKLFSPMSSAPLGSLEDLSVPLAPTPPPAEISSGRRGIDEAAAAPLLIGKKNGGGAELNPKKSELNGTGEDIEGTSVGDDLDASWTTGGLGKWRPAWLKRFATPPWALFWLCFICATQGALVNGLVPSVLSTIERRFDLTGAQLGRITQFYDVAYVLCCIPVSYFGGRHSKPTAIGLGTLVMATGSFLFALPHFLAPRAHLPGPPDPLMAIGSCQPNRTAADDLSCPHGANWTRVQTELLGDKFRYEVVFCLAHFLHGVGSTGLYTLGVSYLDENVRPALSSLYLGIFYTFAIFGPALGFLMSSFFLRFHTDYFSSTRANLEPMEIEESDPEWVGAWWLGFLCTSLLSFLAVIPILSFPRVLPGAVEWQKSREENNGADETTTIDSPNGDEQIKLAPIHIEKEAKNPAEQQHHSHTGAEGKNFRKSVRDRWDRQKGVRAKLMADLRGIPIAVKRLLSSRSYLFITLAAASAGLLITGQSTFMAKYLERQFTVPSSRANMLIGMIMVPCAGIGTLASGYIVTRCRLSCLRTLKFCISVCALSLVLSPMYLVYCDPVKMAGVQQNYPGETEDFVNSSSLVSLNWHQSLLEYFYGDPEKIYNLTGAQCNRHCGCTDKEFHPVCGKVDKRVYTFYSSCFAGCPEPYHPSTKTYFNCSCAMGGPVQRGWCESDCAYLSVFLFLFAPMCLFTFSIGVPAITVVLRTVDYNERPFALGIQWILIRCIGTIPAPQLFGLLFDQSCLKNHSNPCEPDEKGKCFAYDNKKLSNLFLVFALVGQTVTLIFLVLAAMSFKGRGRAEEKPIEAD